MDYEFAPISVIAMSIWSIEDIIKRDWGLEDGDLDKIIRIERLKDVTQRFFERTRTITETFGAVSKLRIIAFDENSGVDPRSRNLFRAFITGGRDIFYYARLSNRECCVVLINEIQGTKRLETHDHILAHEYAHHYQFTHGNFPYYVPKRRPLERVPPFALPCEVGPEHGSVFIDGSPLNDLHTVISDSNERVSDITCEGLLRERGMAKGLLEMFQDDLENLKDPAIYVSDNIPYIKRYVRRLALRDSAEWGATVYLACQGSDEVKKVISKHKKLVLRLNKKFPKAAQAYDEIHRLCVDMDFNLFKYPDECVKYTKNVMNLLNIRIKTSEEW